MIPEIKIVLYVLFIISLFVFAGPYVYGVFFVILFFFLSRMPFEKVKSGWLPISLFLLFTFIGNLLNRHGRIVFSAGPLQITEEGFVIASVRTLRVLFMIAGAKILMHAAKPEQVVNALGRLMSPLEKLHIPVKDFFHTMALTLQCFPVLKNMATEAYRENVSTADIRGVRDRVRVISAFLLPMFVKSIRCPEAFFEKKGR